MSMKSITLVCLEYIALTLLRFTFHHLSIVIVNDVVAYFKSLVHFYRTERLSVHFYQIEIPCVYTDKQRCALLPDTLFDCKHK